MMTTSAKSVQDAEALLVGAGFKTRSSYADASIQENKPPGERHGGDQFRAVVRVMETRHERNTEGIRGSRSNDREDVIDLTAGDASSCDNVVDSDAPYKRLEINKAGCSEESHITNAINSEDQKEVKMSEFSRNSDSRANSIYEKSGFASNESSSKRLKERADERKRITRKSRLVDTETRRKHDPRQLNKNEKNALESYTRDENRDRPAPQNDASEELSAEKNDSSKRPERREDIIEIDESTFTQKSLDQKEVISRSTGANLLLSESSGKKPSEMTTAAIEEAMNLGDTENSHVVTNTTVGFERAEIDSQSNDGDYSSDCAWYFCAGGKRDLSTEAKASNIENVSSAEIADNPIARCGKLGNVLEGSSEDDTGLWNTIKDWIDPAPTLLMESLHEAAEAKSRQVLGITTGSTDISASNRDFAKSESVPSDCQASIRQSRLITSVDASGAMLTDSAHVIDEDPDDVNHGLFEHSPMPGSLTEAENASSKAPSHQMSAFEQVKTVCISPAASLEHSSDKDDDCSLTRVDGDDSSVDASAINLLGDDLKSLPSVKEDVATEVSDVQPYDLGSRLPDLPSIVENITKLRINESKRELMNNSTLTVDDSFEARRQSLVKELRSTIATHGRYDIRCAAISSALGDLLDESGEYAHAVRLHKDAVTIYSCKLGDDHSTTMSAKMRLGVVLENAQQFDEAIGLYYLVTVMRRALNGENEPSVADGLVRMAQALRKKSDFLQAIKELKRALKIYRESLGDAHEKVASTVDQIASLYVTVGDFDKSASILEEVVKLKAATIGMSSRAVAQTLSTLATTYECSEKFNNAMKALKKAYKIYTELDGYSSEDSTATLNRIAQLYEAMGDQNRASIAYLGVLRARKILRGSDSLAVGETYFRLGHSLRETGQFEKALKCLKEALPIFVGQGVEMNDMKMVADIMHEMAFINQDRGNYQDAVRIFKQELSVRRKIGQPEFPLVARTLNHLGVAEFELNNNSRALKYLVEALTIFQERGEQGIECAEVLFNTGLVFDAAQNKQRALEAYTEAARIFRDHGYKEDHPHLKKANEKIDNARRVLDSYDN